MDKHTKTREQLLDEIDKLRGRIAGLEKSEIGHKKIEEALRKSEEDLKGMIMGLAEGFYSATPDGKLLVYNNEFARVLGLDPDRDYSGIELPDFWLKPAERKSYINELRRNGFIKGYRIEARRADGEIITVLINARITKDRKGRAVRTEGTIMDITGRKQAEDEMKVKSEILSNMSEAVFLIRAEDGFIVYDNEEFDKMFGYSHNEIMGKHVSIVNAPAGKSPGETAMEIMAIIAEKGKWEGEIYNIKKDGTKFWTWARVTTFNHPEFGEVLISVHRDITSGKKAEARLANSEERFRLISENSREWIWEVDSNGLYTYASQRIEDILGYKPHEIVGKKHFFDLFHPEEREELKKAAFELIRQQLPFREFINRNITKSGEIVWFSSSGVPMTDSEGNMRGYRGADLNITERMRSEQIRKVLYNISDAVSTSDNLKELISVIRKELTNIIDTTNFYVALYDRMTDTLSFPYYDDEKDEYPTIPAANTLTKHIIDIKKPLLVNSDVARMLLKEGKIKQSGSPSKIWLGVPLKIEGEVTGVLTVQSYTDEFAYDESDLRMLEFISDQIGVSIARKKAEEDLIAALEKAEESDRLKSTFLATMSHELRTPLNAVLGFSELIDEETPFDDIISYNKLINKSSIHLLRIIEDLFDVTLIESGNILIKYAEHRIDSLLNFVHETILFEQINLNKSHLKIYQTIPPALKDQLIYTDQQRFTQVMLNLLKNAFKFTLKGSIGYGFTRELQDASPVLKFYVKDTGIGISEENKEMIFDSFTQTDSSYSRLYGGVGIGLSISRKLVQAMGGRIWVESAPGKGSVFYFTLPDHEKEKIPEITQKRSADKVHSRKRTILIAEDDDAGHKFLEVVLKKSGFESVRAKDGREAVDLCKENRALDLVLMDINMPVMNGLEATKQIKKIRPELPVIAQTAYAVSEDSEKALSAGCDDYITKPIKKDLLMAMIDRLLQEQQ